MKLVSVIMPIYNREDCMKKAIESCLSQTYTNIELILVNDGSTDNTQKVAQSYVDMDARVVLYNQENGGAASARNTGLKHANGAYIQFLDSDDTLEKNCISKAVSTIEQYPDASFLVYGFNIYSADKLLRTPNPGTGIYRPGDPYENFRSIQRLLDSPCNKLYKRSYITKLFDATRVFAEDAIFNYENLTAQDTIPFIEDNFYNVQLSTSESVNKRYKKGKILDFLYTCELMEKKLSMVFPNEFDREAHKTQKLSQIGSIIGNMARNTSLSDFQNELELARKLPYFQEIIRYRKKLRIHKRLLYVFVEKKTYFLAKVCGATMNVLYQAIQK